MEEKNAALDWLELMAGRGIGALAQKMQRQGGKTFCPCEHGTLSLRKDCPIAGN